MVTKVGGTSSASRFHGMPTAAELKKIYAGIAEKALAKGAKPLKAAPKGIEKYSSVDITPKGKLGVDQKVYMFKGELYLKSSVVAPNAKPTWYNIGPAPMF